MTESHSIGGLQGKVWLTSLQSARTRIYLSGRATVPFLMLQARWRWSAGLMCRAAFVYSIRKSATYQDKIAPQHVVQWNFVPLWRNAGTQHCVPRKIISLVRDVWNDPAIRGIAKTRAYNFVLNFPGSMTQKLFSPEKYSKAGQYTV